MLDQSFGRKPRFELVLNAEPAVFQRVVAKKIESEIAFNSQYPRNRTINEPLGAKWKSAIEMRQISRTVNVECRFNYSFFPFLNRTVRF